MRQQSEMKHNLAELIKEIRKNHKKMNPSEKQQKGDKTVKAQCMI